MYMEHYRDMYAPLLPEEENYKEQRKYKRQYRELPQETKERISSATKGKQKTATHRQHIADSMREYWKGVPHRPQGEDGESNTEI